MQKTRIEYLTHTWNPIKMTCSPVSAGCANCWHIAMGKRFGKHMGKPVLKEEELVAPLRLRASATIGVQFMGDLFHEDVPEVFIDKVLDTIASCPQHIFIILTKRPIGGYTFKHSGDYPLKNCWFGVSVEDQKTADERIPYLFDKNFTWHNNKFVSYEPALSPIDFRQFLPRAMPPDHDGGTGYMTSGLDWIVMGGENGKGARPMSPDWARKTRDDCKAVGVPFFFKGGLLDGKEHKEMPR